MFAEKAEQKTQQMTDSNYIWYACYGSNLFQERFHCYIKGGQPEGSLTYYRGCTDKTLPRDSEELFICSELYFAKKSNSWNGCGVAFIKTNFGISASTLARQYLITKEQFTEIVKQETETIENLYIDFEFAKKQGSYVFKENSYYGNIIYLSDQYNYPVFTITNEKNLSTYNAPSVEYLKAIVKGIQETHTYLSVEEIAEYLITKQGIIDNFNKEELLKIIS